MTEKDTIKFSDFEKLEIRVGTVEEAEPIEGSDKLIKLRVLLEKCEDPDNCETDCKIRYLVAGIAKEYDKDYLIGKQVVVLVNLESKKMMGEESQGMILAADVDGVPVLLHPERKIPDGSVVR